MSQGSEAKTEAPTPKRLREARRRGQVAKSTELSGALSLLCTLLCVVAMAPWAAQQVAGFWLAVEASMAAVSVSGVQALVLQAMVLAAQLSLVPLAVAAVVFVGSLWLQTGAVFSLEPVKPLLERIDPVAGARRLFSAKSLAQFGLMLAKAAIIGAAALLVCMNTLGDAIRVIHVDAGAALAVANAALMNLLLWCGGLFALLGLLDLAYQRWQHLRELRMSSSEVRREHRDEQGDAHLKSQRRHFAQEPVPREQLAFIHMASLAVCDTEGRVVVLVYRSRHFPLPMCLVRGSAEFGAEVLVAVRERRVPTVVDPRLLTALYPIAHSGVPVPASQAEAVLGYLRAAAAA